MYIIEAERLRVTNTDGSVAIDYERLRIALSNTPSTATGRPGSIGHPREEASKRVLSTPQFRESSMRSQTITWRRAPKRRAQRGRHARRTAPRSAGAPSTSRPGQPQRHRALDDGYSTTTHRRIPGSILSTNHSRVRRIRGGEGQCPAAYQDRQRRAAPDQTPALT